MAIQLSNSNNNASNKIIMDSVDLQFYNEINDEITLDGQIPYTLPEKLVINSIKDAAKYFFDWHPTVDRPAYYLVDFASFKNEIYKQEGKLDERSVRLSIDPSISVVKKVWESSYAYNFHEALDENFSNGDTRNSLSSHGIDTNLYYQSQTTRMVEIQMTKSVFSTSIVFKYNQHDGTLWLKTLPKSEKLLIECKKHIHIHNLYRDQYYKRLVMGYCKQKLRRVLAGHTFELPGGVTMSADDICDNLDDIQVVHDIIKSQSTMGNIIIKRHN